MRLYLHGKVDDDWAKTKRCTTLDLVGGNMRRTNNNNNNNNGIKGTSTQVASQAYNLATFEVEPNLKVTFFQ